MKRRPILASLIGLAILSGCSSRPGDAALAKGLDSGANAIDPYVAVGIAAKSDPEIAARLDVAPITPEMATFVRETWAWHRSLIERARDRAAGTVNPDAPIPSGPSNSPVRR